MWDIIFEVYFKVHVSTHLSFIANSKNYRNVVAQMCTTDGFSPNVKKDRRKFGLRKKKSGKGSSVDFNSSSSPNKTTVDNESSSPLSVRKKPLL